VRHEDRLESIEEPHNWISPLLGIRFKLEPDTLEIYRPDGQPFLSFVDLDLLRQAAEQRADVAEQRAESAEQRAEKLAAKLQELGIDPANI
jgi:hypothetical protein